MKWCVIVAIAPGLLASPVAAQVQTFVDDYDGFRQAAGELRTIDFETLPDGQQSYGGVPITETFNYDLQGAHFTAEQTVPLIAGNRYSGFRLGASRRFPWERTWLIGDLVTPALAVGVFYPGHTQLCAFDAAGGEIGCVRGETSGFIGIVSETQIDQTIVDRGGVAEDIDAFVFSPIPEPATILLVVMAAGAPTIFRSRQRPA